MGTNYYVHSNANDTVCPTCGHPTQSKIHIGKSSFGWCFGLHCVPELGLNSWQDWRRFLKHRCVTNKTHVIKNEYDDVIDLNELTKIVTKRKNFSIHGKSLARHAIDNKFCVGHGPGASTWDLLVGEYS